DVGRGRSARVRHVRCVLGGSGPPADARRQSRRTAGGMAGGAGSRVAADSTGSRRLRAPPGAGGLAGSAAARPRAHLAPRCRGGGGGGTVSAGGGAAPRRSGAGKSPEGA